MTHLLLFLFALLPGFLWLLYYLRKDKNPEPKKLIALVFFTGAVFAIIGYFFQQYLFSLLSLFEKNFPYLAFFALYFHKFFIIAFTEEFLKYLAVIFTMKENIELDEPIDIIIYMITAAMGFATLENIIIFFSLDIVTISFAEMAKISLLRLFSGTLLHLLSSGILGIFIIYFYRFNKPLILFFGFLVATFFHGLYNMIASRVEMDAALFVPLLILFFVSLSLILSFGIKRAKKMRSVCIVKK